MARIAFHLLLATIVAATSGCCMRKSCQKNCPPYTREARHVPISEKQAGVRINFDGLPGYEEARQPLFEQLAVGSATVNLKEAICMAANNSELAEMIEAERHALQCQANNCSQNTLDMVLQGEALEQRNKAAGAAAELFLGLTLVEMQRGLLTETRQHLDQLDVKIQAAADAGFATADGKNELEEGRSQLKTAESELSSAEQKLLYQLNLLINNDQENLFFIHPAYELNPTATVMNVRDQATLAAMNRPGIRALESATASDNNDSIYSLLSQFDPRLGIRIPPAPLKSRLVLTRLIEKLEQDEQPDPAATTRLAQIQSIVESRKKAARAEASEAVLNIQSSLEKLAISNERIKQLKARQVQLDAKREINAENAYLEANRIWSELQNEKSERLTAAIEHETAKIKLLEAQGQLVQMCGYDLTFNAESECCQCNDNPQ